MEQGFAVGFYGADMASDFTVVHFVVDDFGVPDNGRQRSPQLVADVA